MQLIDRSTDLLPQADDAELELKQRLSGLMLRRTKAAVLTSILPPCARCLLPIAMLPAEWDSYQRMADGIVSEGAKDVNVLASLMSARIWCSGSSPSKLRLCEAMLEAIVLRGEKAVVVSNFSSTLDAVRLFSRARRWGSLRIDGAVAADKRLKIAQFFNEDQAMQFPLLLLSSRAGGVGLNLVGASRLILLDPDWNPATDEQAMARVWREGQRRPVFIYRMCLAGTVEESILLRQRDKGCLARVLHEDGDEGGTAEGEEAEAFVSGQTLQGLLFPSNRLDDAGALPLDPVAAAIASSLRHVM